MDPGYGSGDRSAAPGLGRPASASVVHRLRQARTDPGSVVLEGVHALKHALRFGADVQVVATPDPASLDALLRRLAPDVADAVGERAILLDTDAWRRATGRQLPSPALSIAVRPPVAVTEVLAAPGVVVVLERPRHLGNLGAVVRVAAAADAGGVLVLGHSDPWHPLAVRGAAGLQFALPVARTDALPSTPRTLVALDGAGDLPGAQDHLPGDALLLVGTERAGLSDALRGRAERSLAIPMRSGVSSLNLATAVAVALYRGR